ncbi:MAG: hypothetical protein ACXWLJ_00970 [Rhizomicrobium sp.]
MRHASQIIALAFAAISLAACAHPQPPPPVVDLAGMQCSPAVRLDDAAPLALDKDGEKRETALLDGHAHCVEEPSGYRSLYRVFALPPMAAPSVITVSALPWGNTMLPPRAAFLDATGKTVRETTHADFTFRGAVLSALLRSHPGENYLVLLSDAEVLGHSVSRISGSVQVNYAAAGPVMIAMYSGHDTTTDLVFTPVGNVSVSIAPIPTK